MGMGMLFEFIPTGEVFESNVLLINDLWWGF